MLDIADIVRDGDVTTVEFAKVRFRVNACRITGNPEVTDSSLGIASSEAPDFPLQGLDERFPTSVVD